MAVYFLGCYAAAGYFVESDYNLDFDLKERADYLFISMAILGLAIFFVYFILAFKTSYEAVIHDTQTFAFKEKLN